MMNSQNNRGAFNAPFDVKSPRTRPNRQEIRRAHQTVCLLSLQEQLREAAVREVKENENKNRRKSLPPVSSWDLTSSWWHELSDPELERISTGLALLSSFEMFGDEETDEGALTRIIDGMFDEQEQTDASAQPLVPDESQSKEPIGDKAQMPRQGRVRPLQPFVRHGPSDDEPLPSQKHSNRPTTQSEGTGLSNSRRGQIPLPLRPSLENFGKRPSKSVFVLPTDVKPVQPKEREFVTSKPQHDRDVEALKSPRVYSTLSELLVELEFGSTAVSYDNAHTLLGGSVEGLIRHGVSFGDAKFLGEFVMTLDYWGNIGSVLDKLSDIFVQIRTIKEGKNKVASGGTVGRGQQRAWAAVGRTAKANQDRTSEPNPNISNSSGSNPSTPTSNNTNSNASPPPVQNSNNAPVKNLSPQQQANPSVAPNAGFKIASLPYSMQHQDRTAFASSANANSSTSSSAMHQQQQQSATAGFQPAQQPGGPMSPRQHRETGRNNFLVRKPLGLPTATENSATASGALTSEEASSASLNSSGVGILSDRSPNESQRSEEADGQMSLSQNLSASDSSISNTTTSHDSHAQTHAENQFTERTKWADMRPRTSVGAQDGKHETLPPVTPHWSTNMKLDLRGKKVSESADTISQQLRDQLPPVLLSPKRTHATPQLERAETHAGTFPMSPSSQNRQSQPSSQSPSRVVEQQSQSQQSQQPTQAKSASNSPFNSNAKDRPLTFSSPDNRQVPRRDSAKELRISAGIERGRERKCSLEAVFHNHDFDTDPVEQPVPTSASGRRMLTKASSVTSVPSSQSMRISGSDISLGNAATGAGSGSQERVFNAEKLKYRRSSEKMLRKNLSRTKTSDAFTPHRESLSSMFNEATDGSSDGSRDSKGESSLREMRDEPFQWSRKPKELSDSPSDGSEALSEALADEESSRGDTSEPRDSLKSEVPRMDSFEKKPRRVAQSGDPSKQAQPTANASIAAFARSQSQMARDGPERSDTPPTRPQRPATPPAPLQQSTNSLHPTPQQQQANDALLRATSRALQQENNAYAILSNSQTSGFLVQSDKANTKKKLDKKRDTAGEGREKVDKEKKKPNKNAYEVEIIPEFKETKKGLFSNANMPAKQSYAFSESSLVDGGSDPVGLVESRIVALIFSIIDFNPTYFEDVPTLKKLTQLINMFEANDKVEAIELLKYRTKQNALSELFGQLLEGQGIVKNSDIKKINNIEFSKESVLKLAKAPVLPEDMEQFFNELIFSGMATCKSKTDHSKCYFNISHEEYLQSRLYRFNPGPSASALTVMSFKPLQFAKAMAYLEFRLFKRVSIYEINYWMRGNKAKRAHFAPYLTQLTDFVNQVTNWVATEIVQIPNSKMRQRVIQQFIDIAAHCLKMNHLDGVLEIVGGLTHNSVERMKLTWNELRESKPKVYQQFLQCKELVAPEANWQNLRKVVTDCLKSNQVYVPYLGLWTKDLTFIHDGPPPIQLPKGQVAWSKQSKMAAMLNSIRLLQFGEWPVDSSVDNDILNFLQSGLFCLDEKALYAQSKKTEHSSKAT